MNAQEGREQHQASRSGKAAIRSTPIMISPSVSEVKHSHPAAFAVYRDCPAVEAAPAGRTVPPSGALGVIRETVADGQANHYVSKLVEKLQQPRKLTVRLDSGSVQAYHCD